MTPGDRIRDLTANTAPSNSAFTYIVDGVGGDGKVDKDGIRAWLNLAKSQVTLVKNGVLSHFTPTSDTNSAREIALRAALGEANSTSSVYLGAGNYKVSAGSPLIDSVIEASIGVKIFFGDGASLVYDDYEDAGSDSSLFLGIRNPVHFGAVPDITFQGSPPDSWSAFQAAKFSLPPVDGSSLDEFGDLIRTGTIEIPDGKYAMSAPFVSQAGQTWRGAGGRTLLRYSSNIAPTAGGVTKWAWTVARTDVDGFGPLANFTHDVNLLNLVFDCQSGNELLGCINFSGAQGSSLNLITIAGTFGAGIYCQPYTSNVDFNRIDINFTTGVVGPAFSMEIGNTNLLRSISVVKHNFDASEDDSDSRYSPAYKFNGCNANTLLNLLAENCPRSLMLDSCSFNVFNSVEASFPSVSDTCLLDIVSGGNNVFSSLRGYNAEVLIRAEDVDILGGTPDDWDGTNYTQGIRNFETLDPKKLSLSGTGKYIDFTRPTGAAGAQLFRWQTGQSDSNPALTLTVSSSNGTSSTEVMNVARNNGGNASGYSISMPTLYISIGMRSEKGYAVIQSEDDPTPSDILSGFRQTWFNPAEDEIRDWVNIGGALYKSAAYTPA